MGARDGSAVGVEPGHRRKRQREVKLSAVAPRRGAGAIDNDFRGGARMEGPEQECTTAKSEVVHEASGRKLTYGQLVPQACAIPCPDAKTVKLKDPATFTLIGKETPHLDIPDKCTGTAQFGLDVRVPEMVYAVIARCPTFGGRPAQFDATKALAVPGVLQVFAISARGHRVFAAGGVAVVAKSTWAAMQG